MPERAASESIFAAVDTPAMSALRWLTAQFDGQAERGDADRLLPEQRAELVELLGSTWWRTVFEEDREAGAEDPEILLARGLPLAVRAASRLPHGGLVLAMYLRNLVNDAWAMAWDHTLLTTAIETSCDAADALRLESSQQESDDVARLGWALLRFMLSEFRVETALLTGRLGVVVHIAEAAVAEVEPLVAEIRACPPGEGRDALLREAENELIYYGSVRECARLGYRMLRGDRRNAGSQLESIRAAIDATPFNQMDLSELRGHLAAVDLINGAREREWLHVDAGRIRFVYPFGIRLHGQEDSSEIITAVRRRAEAMRRSGVPIGALPITETRGRLDLSDVWQGTDNFGRGYRGATIRLADLVLEGGGGASLETVQTRIQFSQLGNHAIVFDIELDDAPAYRVAEALQLATPVFGDLCEIEDTLRMRTPTGETVAGIPEVLEGLLAGVRDLLDAEQGSVTGERLATRAGSFGIVVTVVAASVTGPKGRTPLRDAHRLLKLWGVQPLLHPLPSGVASVADWVLHDLDAVETWSLLHLNGELLASSSNMTLLASFASPDFAVNEMESYIEFAHSLHGMYQGWQDSVRYYAERIARLLRNAETILSEADVLDERNEDALSSQRAAALSDLDGLLRDIERTELSLQSFVQSNEAVMLFVESPDIVASPPLRRDLDTILESNGYGRLRDGFTRAVRDVLGTRLQPLLAVVHQRMEQAYAAEAERAREAQARRNGLMFEIVGVVFAVVGFSGLAQILQAGSPGWGSDVAWWLIVGILALAGVTGVALFFAARRGVRTQREKKGRPR